jgi:PAS domain S-box-containing protein
MEHDEQRYRDLVAAVTDYAIFLLDPQGRILTWNAGAQRIKGYTQGEIVGKHFSCFYPSDEVEAGKPAQVLQAAIDGGHHVEEGWRVRKDGSQFWAEVAITPLRDGADELVGFAKVTRDLSERKHALDRLSLVAERERIATELKSGTMKLLFEVGLQLQAAMGFSSDSALRNRLQGSVDALDEAISNLRRYVFGLELGSDESEESR